METSSFLQKSGIFWANKTIELYGNKTKFETILSYSANQSYDYRLVCENFQPQWKKIVFVDRNKNDLVAKFLK
jgi:hypothetical protein